MSSPPSSSPNNLNNLPTEILSVILDLVDASLRDGHVDGAVGAQRQLAHLCRVSNALLAVARDSLYRMITLHLDTGYDRPPPFPSANLGDQAAASNLHPSFSIIHTLIVHPHLGGYVRQLKVCSRDFRQPSNVQLPELAQVLQLCPHLDAVHVSFSGGLGMELGGIVAALNSSRRKLKVLSVGKVDKAETVRGEKGVRRALATFFDVQTDIEELNMRGVDGHLAIATDPPAWQLRKLSTNAPSFAHLALQSTATLKNLDLSYTRNPTSSQRLDLTPFTALQALSLTDRHFGRRSPVDQDFHHFLPLFPHSLTTLRLYINTSLRDTDCELLFALLPPTLVNLDFRHTVANHTVFTDLLSNGLFPRLETLCYTRCLPFGPTVPFAPPNLPRAEEEERQLCELGRRRGVRVLPTGQFISRASYWSRGALGVAAWAASNE